MRNPFSFCISISDKHIFNIMCHAMYHCAWMNVWVLKFIFCLIFFLFLLLGFITLLSPYAFTSLLFFWLVMLLSTLWRDIFDLMPSYHITNFSVLEICDSLTPSSLENKWTFFFFVLDFSLDSHVVNKFIVSNENLL